MRYKGRIISVSLAMIAHSSFVIYFSIKFGDVHIVSLLGYPLWFLIAYWTGKQHDLAAYYSEIDPLTNLYNRRFVINSFEKITSLAERTKSKLFVLIIDCDNFKDINDLNGHQKGDMVLSMIGETLVDTTRKSDIVGRWGGDEFIVIGHFKEASGLKIILQRIEENLQNLSNQINIPVMVSIGTAGYPDDSKDLSELIKMADKDMYKSKLTKKAEKRCVFST